MSNDTFFLANKSNGSNGSKGAGNTNSPPEKEKKNTRDAPKKQWCFTWNNYTDTDYGSMISYFCKGDQWIIGKEVGEKGTPHLQGYINFEKKVRFTALIKVFPKCHWEAAKGNAKANIKYCSKENNFKTNMRVPRQIQWPKKWHPWQEKILEEIQIEPNNRTINWIWEEKGNTGKTTLCNYLALEKNALLVPSKKNDAFHAIAKRFEDTGEIDIVIIDVPRDSLDYICYTAIEKIKDGQVISGKYEGCQCIFPSPHLYIFANEPPKLHKFSADRWNVINIDLK